LYNKLCNNIQGISEFLTLVLCHSDLPILDNIAIIDNRDDLVEFIAKLRQFYIDTDFEYFFEKNQPEYKQLIRDYGKTEEINKNKEIIDNYLGTETKNYNIIISALLFGCFGLKIQTKENLIHSYSLLSPYDYVNNNYLFGPEDYKKENLWHELSHLTINDLTKRHIGQINKEEKTVPNVFVRQFYTNVETVINEYIIRAVTIRLFEKTNNTKLVKCFIEDNIKDGFTDIESVKNYIAENCEKNNKLMKDERYKELVEYVIDKI
jgi:hypothetical protein